MSPGPRPALATMTSLAVLAGREVAAVDRLRQELRLVVGPELADMRIGLDHRVPELRLAVAEHLLLLDLLDVDVLYRASRRRIERGGAARRGGGGARRRRGGGGRPRGGAA